MTDITIFPEWAREWATKRLNGQDVLNADVIAVKDWLNIYAKENPKIIHKIMKLRWEDAVIAQKKWHKSLLEKSEKLKEYGGNPNDIEKIMDGYNGNTWNYITSKEGLEFEGNVMGHCVGGYTYKDKNIITLRDKNNVAHVTIELNGNHIVQIQGKGNSAIHSRYSDDVSKLINELELSIDFINIEGVTIIKNHSKNNYAFNQNDKLIHYIQKNINDDMEFFSKVELSYRDQIYLEIPDIIDTDYDDETLYTTIKDLPKNVVNKILNMNIEMLHINSSDFVNNIKDVNDFNIKQIHFFQGITEEHVDFLNKINRNDNLKTNIENYILNNVYTLPSIKNENINMTFNAIKINNFKKIIINNSTLSNISFKNLNNKNINVEIKNSNIKDIGLTKLNDINLVMDNVVMDYLRVKSFNSFEYKDVFLNHFIYGNNNSNNEYVIFYNNDNGELKHVSYDEYCNKIANTRRNKENINNLELFPNNSELLWLNNDMKTFRIPDYTKIKFSVDTKNINIIGNNVTFEGELKLNKKMISIGENVVAPSVLISDKRFLDLNIEGKEMFVIDIPEVNINDNLKFEHIKLINCSDVTINNYTCKQLKINYAQNIDVQNTEPNSITIKTKESVEEMVESFIPPINMDNVTIDFVDQKNKHYPYEELSSQGYKM